MATIPMNYGRLAAEFSSGMQSPTMSQVALDEDFKSELAERLPDLWCDAYARMPNSAVQIVQVHDHGYEFLFDLGAERVVAAFGRSSENPAKRDSARMSGFLGKTTSDRQQDELAAQLAPKQRERRRHPASMSFRERFFETHGDKFDRGHFMSHRQGGGLNINLYPQRADINQGRGTQGKHYRQMEKACVANQGVFCFSRPLYKDHTWVPDELEYGVIGGLGRIQVAVFPNR